MDACANGRNKKESAQKLSLNGVGMLNICNAFKIECSRVDCNTDAEQCDQIRLFLMLWGTF